MRVDKPTLILDAEKCRQNIAAMALKARDCGVDFRPHFKTHQSAEIGQWFKEQGVEKITVSSVDMAIYFADHGWKNILVAFPVNILEIDPINILSNRVNLFLTVESGFTVNFLANNLTNKVGIYIEIDEGYHRTGIAIENKIEIEHILKKIKKSELMYFEGFMAHFGQTYSAKNKYEVKTIYEASIKKLTHLKHEFKGLYPEIKVSVGDTPSCSILEDFAGADEIRPGNFVFFDVMQQFIGSCHPEDISLALACPVIATYPDRNEIAIYGGAVHLSKEYCLQSDGRKIFGLVVEFKSGGWGRPLKDTYVDRLSQEHGIIISKPDIIRRIVPGDTIGILPVHSCLTADLANNYLTFDGSSISKRRS